MIAESATMPSACLWFTTLVSQASHLAVLKRSVAGVHVSDARVIDMGQGQKSSRLLAWTFLRVDEHERWRKSRWSS
jgi:23S rRNA (adenine1618-N6)-methyltransferase